METVVPGDMVFVVVGQWKRPGGRQPVGDHHPGAPRLLQGSLTICWAMVPVPSSGGGGGGLVNTGDWRGRPAPVVVGEVLPVGALHASTMIVKIMYDKRGVSFMTSAVGE